MLQVAKLILWQILDNMKILLLGSAFDPPHNGHLLMASEVVKRGIADKVILLPCGSHAFGKVMSDANDRVAMTKIMGATNFETSLLEVAKPKVSYTWDSLEEMVQLYPGDEIGWLAGSDQLPNFHKFFRYQDILAKYPVYIYPRAGYPMEPLLPGMIEIEGVPVVKVASSTIREAYRNNQDIGEWVLPEVLQYIKEHKLWTK